jgi:hypothetical protein
MRTRAKFSVLIALLVFGIAGCTQNGTTTTTTPPDPAVPATNDAPEPDPDQPEEANVAVFFVRSAPDRFYVEPEYRVGDPNLGPVAAATEALTLLFDASAPGSALAPADPELFTSVPEGITVNAVSIDNDTVVVDMAGFAGTSGASAQEVTMLLQVAHTATAASGTTSMQVLFDGEVQEELWGHLDVSEVADVSVFDLSPVTIEMPDYGATVPIGEVTFSGEARVFEATVEIVLINAETGATAHSGFVNATIGGPERGSWTFTFTFNQPGTYTLSAGETDPSDGEGREPFFATRTIVVN